MYWNDVQYCVCNVEENRVSETYSCLVSVSASVPVQFEPVGRWFEAFLKRRCRNVSASFQELEEEEELSEEEEDEELQLEEYPMLKKLDPKDWKVCVEPRLRVRAVRLWMHWHASLDVTEPRPLRCFRTRARAVQSNPETDQSCS